MNVTSKIYKNLCRFRLITFDVTDTLLKFRMPPAIQYNKVANKYGYNLNPDEMNTIFRIEFKYMFKKFPNFGKNSNLKWDDWWRKLIFNIFMSTGAMIPQEDLKQIANELIKLYRTENGNCWLKTNGANDFVNDIKNLDKNCGIISNFDPSLHDIINFMKFPKFDFILTSYETGYLKPNKEIFDKALELGNNCKCNEALHIGNSLEFDYLGALNAGWSSILINDPNDLSTASIENKKKINKKHSFNSLQHALDTLNKHEVEW